MRKKKMKSKNRIKNMPEKYNISDSSDEENLSDHENSYFTIKKKYIMIIQKSTLNSLKISYEYILLLN